MRFLELSFDDYLDILNPNFGNIKFYNLFTNKGFFVYQDKYKGLSFDAIKGKIKGTPQLTENEKEYVEKYGYEKLQSINPNLYTDKLGLSMSTCSYYSQKTIQSQIATIKSFAIDVDFKNDSTLENYSAEQYFSEMFLDLEEIGLLPTLVEYGHCFRMIYVFENVIKIPQKNNGRFINLYKKLTKTISDRINQEFDCNAEPQQINSYYRLPNSINEKDLSEIHVIKTGDFYDFDDLVSKFMDEKPENYKYKKKKNKKYFSNGMEKRYNDLLKLIPFIEVGKRELFLHIIYQTLLSFLDKNEAVFETLKINNLLKNPLNEKQIKNSITKFSRRYFYKNGTIAEKLGLSKEICSDLDLFTPIKNKKENSRRFREKEKLNKIKKGKTKKQEIEKIVNKLANEIGSSDFDMKKFCNENKISKSTFYRYKAMIVIVNAEYNEIDKENRLYIDNDDVIVFSKKNENENQNKVVNNIVKKYMKRVSGENVVNNRISTIFSFDLLWKDVKNLRKEKIFIRKLYIIRKNIN